MHGYWRISSCEERLLLNISCFTLGVMSCACALHFASHNHTQCQNSLLTATLLARKGFLQYARLLSFPEIIVAHIPPWIYATDFDGGFRSHRISFHRIHFPVSQKKGKGPLHCFRNMQSMFPIFTISESQLYFTNYVDTWSYYLLMLAHRGTRKGRRWLHRIV